MVRAAVLVLLGVAEFAGAQTVYESKSGQGRVFSDRPTPGAHPIEMRPLTVIEPIPVSPAAAPAADVSGRSNDGKALPAYRSFAVVFPEPDGSVAINNGTFQVNLRSDPPLQIGLGHAFSLRLNGRQVPGRYTATEFMIPQEFFGDVVPVAVQRYQLDAYIVDATGTAVMSAAPVQFFGRYITILQNPQYRHQYPQPLQPVKPIQPRLPSYPQAQPPQPVRPAAAPANPIRRPGEERPVSPGSGRPPQAPDKEPAGRP